MMNRQSQPPQNERLNNKIINQAYRLGRNNNRTYEVLTNIFHTIQLAEQNKRSPGLYTTQITASIRNKLQSKQGANVKPIFLDPKATYPMNKQGAVNTLQRVCNIVEGGIQQRQGNNQKSKFTQIIGFNNQIQTQKTKNNEKLSWIKDNKQYPYRIILRDKNNKIKAIYFKTSQQAEKVRIYYIDKLLYKGNFKKLIQERDRRYKLKTAENFKANLIRYKNQKMSRLKQERSKSRISLEDPKLNKNNEKQPQFILNQHKSIDPIKDLQQRNSKSQSNINPNLAPPHNTIQNSNIKIQDNEKNIQNTSLKSQGQKGYNNDLMNNIMETRSSNSKSDSIGGNILQLQNFYKKKLLVNWLLKAQDAKSNQLIQAQNPAKNISSSIIPAKSKFGQRQSQRLSQRRDESLKPPTSQGQQSLSAGTSSSISYKSIQFLRQKNIFIKPIVILSLHKQNSIQIQSKFNTIIQKRDPYLQYELVLNNGDSVHKIKGSIKDYSIGIRAVDYLTNSQICNDKIELKNKVLSQHTFLMNNEKSVRIEIYFNSKEANKIIQGKENNVEGLFLEIKGLGEKTIEEIRNFWEKQSVKRGYYNISKDIRIIEIFQLIQQPPKSWVLGLSQSTYNLISILNSASVVLKFKLIQSILPILNVLTKLYSQIDELIEVCLSILTNYMRPYYIPSQFNRINKLHSLLGLEGQIDFSSKVGFQMELIKRIIRIQCPDFQDRMQRRNIGFVHVLYQYIYQIFSKNFSPKILIDVWNFIFKDPFMLPVYMILLSVWLVKFYCEKLKKCYRVRELIEVLQSHQTCEVDLIIREIIILRQKYFNSQNLTIIDSIKQMFNTKPLEQVVIEFYKRQTQRLDRRKQNRNIQKNVILQKLSNQLFIQLPKYPYRTYCFHIYFYKLPPVPGSLYIKANGIEYECLNLPKNKYFIIGDVSTEITLQFINNRSDQFTCKLKCMQGINRYTVQLTSNKDNQVYKVQYICGLLTQSHLQALKKNKKFQHYLGSFVKQEEIFDQFLRPISQCSFLNGFGKRLQKDDLGKKIKVIFSTGSKNFDQIEFYLRWIYVCPITLKQKIKLIKEYSRNLSQQFFLSDYKQLQKIFMMKFLQMLQFHISPGEFHSYYSDNLQCQLKSPKICKCRLVLPNGAEHKLQNIANEYICNKSHTHLHEDIIINQLISSIQKQIQSIMSNVNITQATLSMVYSSNGEIKSLQIPIVKKKSGKDLVIDDSKFQFENSQSYDLSTVQPQILLTQILPTFSKISTILDFVNQSKSIQSLGKTKQVKNIPQTINVLKNCGIKLQKVIMMRYHTHPTIFKIPFLDYYHELTCDSVQPHLPRNIFLNNLQTDIKSVCTYTGFLSFSDNKRVQSTNLDRDFGLYGNLRILSPKIQSLYFTTLLVEDKLQCNAELFVNYGYGIFKWEPCIVLGYTHILKQKENNINKNRQPKKYYLVRYEGNQKLFKDFQLRMDPKVEYSLQQLDAKSLSSMRINMSNIKKMGQITSPKRQIGSISNRNVTQTQSRRNFYNF